MTGLKHPGLFNTPEKLVRRGFSGRFIFFFHFLANQLGVPRFRIDNSGHGQTTAGHRVGIFLLDYYAVFDDFGGGWWQLAPYRSRLLGCATGQ
jgi:hypothetical protein